MVSTSMSIPSLVLGAFVSLLHAEMSLRVLQIPDAAEPQFRPNPKAFEDQLQFLFILATMPLGPGRAAWKALLNEGWWCVLEEPSNLSFRFWDLCGNQSAHGVPFNQGSAQMHTSGR